MHFLCTADWQLPPRPGRGGWGGIRETADDAWRALAGAVDVCLDRNCALLGAGDLFDASQISASALARAAGILKPLAAAGLPVCYVLGNHDGGEDWLAPVPGCVNVEHTLGHFWGLTVGGTGYSADFKPATWAGVTDVGLYHQPWKDWTFRGNVALAELPGHALAVCGDIHISSVVKPTTGPATAVSPGSLVPMRIGEETQGYGVALLYDADEKSVTTDMLPGRRRYIRLPATDPDAALAEASLEGMSTAGVPLAVLFEAAEFRPGFQEAARAAGARSNFVCGFRRVGRSDPKAARSADVAEVRRRAVTALADAVGRWPGLSDSERSLAIALADSSRVPTEVLAAAKPGGSP